MSTSYRLYVGPALVIEAELCQDVNMDRLVVDQLNETLCLSEFRQAEVRSRPHDEIPSDDVVVLIPNIRGFGFPLTPDQDWPMFLSVDERKMKADMKKFHHQFLDDICQVLTSIGVSHWSTHNRDKDGAAIEWVLAGMMW